MSARKTTSETRRILRARSRVRRAANGRPRLSVYRSAQHIYAQIIDDTQGSTLAAASTMDKDLKGKLKKPGTSAAAAEVGKLVAERAKKAGVKEVIFDRGGYAFHGRVKALAEAAREAGLAF